MMVDLCFCEVCPVESVGLFELDFDLDYIGKTVFLSREEAERALERSEG